MKKVAVMLVLSLVFVAAMPVMSFAVEPMLMNAHMRIEKERTLPDGTRVKETETVIKPSKSGAVKGAAAGAAAGAMVAGPIGAFIGGVAGGIAGWIYGPAD